MSKLVQKVTTDLYSIQMKWVAWYLPIVYILYLVVLVFVLEPEIQAMSLLTFTFQTATIFMLVCGILSSFVFLPIYVKHGVTRKTYFQATILSSLALVITIMTITALVTWVFTLFDGSIGIFNNVQLSLLSTADPKWFLTILSYCIVIFIYFLAGWLISLGFYRYGAAGGFGCIAAALVFISVTDLFYNFKTPKPIVGIFPQVTLTSQIGIAIAFSLLIIAVVIAFVHKITKDIAIKVE
ncbi:hypothetical protein N0O92_08310 [Alkalihalobacillus sp. MEB130]|uniref:hypothetical protein n=1 Tax=Alkalihalobacillus sp. MEB130 TaxID=2976704 RepID=UPI0028DFAE53|nr:hypothetical protein [Alkalihalobacillus sp. MEB130]MDT8860235.1 hypothetical protein [Alkalihalobacillus sp. MEB130]